LGGKALAEYIATTAESLPGYYKYCRHQHHINRRASEWGRCIEKFYYPYGTSPKRTGTFAEMKEQGEKENKVNKNRQDSAVNRIKAGIAYLKEKLSELPKKVGELKIELLKAIQKLFGVRPSDKTLNKYKNLWHPSCIMTEEEKTTTTKETPVPQEEAKPPEPAPVKESKPCPTPKQKPEKNGHSETPVNPIPAEESEELATPPLYMKVLFWAVNGVRLIYRGEPVLGSVLLAGEKQTSTQTIQTNQEVSINYSTNSKFLLNSEDPNLEVSIKPIDQKSTWQNGIKVRAKDLLEIP
jgi:hypothetical protein